MILRLEIIWESRSRFERRFSTALNPNDDVISILSASPFRETLHESSLELLTWKIHSLSRSTFTSSTAITISPVLSWPLSSSTQTALSNIWFTEVSRYRKQSNQRRSRSQRDSDPVPRVSDPYRGWIESSRMGSRLLIIEPQKLWIHDTHRKSIWKSKSIIDSKSSKWIYIYIYIRMYYPLTDDWIDYFCVIYLNNRNFLEVRSMMTKTKKTFISIYICIYIYLINQYSTIITFRTLRIDLIWRNKNFSHKRN